MFETYRMLGRERQAELEAEADRLRPLAGRPINRIAIVIIAVGLAAVAFGATVARAEVWLDSAVAPQAASQPAAPDLIERWVASNTTHVLAPDDLVRVRASGPTIQAAQPDLVERWVASHRRQVSHTSVSSSNSNPSQAFDWGAAFVGASIVMALALVVGIGIGITRRLRIPSAAS
jgi:hypothetical protein